MITIYKFDTKRFSIYVSCSFDQDYDASFDETGEAEQKIQSGEWGAYVFHAEVIHRETGAVLGESFLGNSIHENPSDFRDHIGAKGRWGSYFRDMISDACHQARSSIRAMHGVIVRV
tara:strand:- start:562 stop:912 length:351 start_codon:yes stop_codon:yes gene_type:complete